MCTIDVGVNESKRNILYAIKNLVNYHLLFSNEHIAQIQVYLKGN